MNNSYIRTAGVQPGRHWTAVGLVISACLSCTSLAAGSGSFQVRYFSVPAPLTPLDSLSLGAQYQSQPGQAINTAFNLNLERRRMQLSARVSSARHALQLLGRRQLDTEANRRDTSTTITYTYTPEIPAQGPTLTSFTALYAYSENQSSQSAVQTHTSGLNVSGRLSPEITAAATATMTATALERDTILSGAGSASFTYAHDITSAYMSPSVSVQNGTTSWTLSAGGSTRLTDSLTANTTVNWTEGQTPSAAVSGQYETGLWQFSGTAGYASQAVSLGVGVQVKLPADLKLGTAVNWSPNTGAATYTASVDKRLGPVAAGLTGSVKTSPHAPNTFGVGATLAAQQQPWTGSIGVSYARTDQRNTGNANGTLSFKSDDFGAQLALGLQLITLPGSANAPVPATRLNGTADLNLTYALTQQIDLSGSVRYERSVAISAQPSYRVGIGIQYRFGGKENQ